MELTPYLFWNIFITLVLAPLMYGIRQNATELKRQDILLNKTREEIAKQYVTKPEVRTEMDLILERFEKLEEKIDKIFDMMYNKNAQR
jgi:archaellum component FlaC